MELLKQLWEKLGDADCTVCGPEGEDLPFDQTVQAHGFIYEGMMLVKDLKKTMTKDAEGICTKLCKYPDIWDEDEEGGPLSDSDMCENCPLNKWTEEDI